MVCPSLRGVHRASPQTVPKVWSLMTLPRMSHSKYADYAACGELYRLKRIEKVPRTPSIYSVAGTAFHEWTDYYDETPPFETECDHEEWYAKRIEKLIDEEESKSGFAFEEWDNPQRKKGANEKVLDQFQMELGPDMIEKYQAWRSNTAWSVAWLPANDGTDDEIAGIEYEVEYTVHGVTGIAKIDRIFEVPEAGELVAVDTKTWSRKRVTAQLPTYLVALRQAGFNVMGATYYEARKGTTTPIQTYKYWDEDRLAALHAQAARMIADGYFLPNPSDACRMCDVRNHCLWYLD